MQDPHYRPDIDGLRAFAVLAVVLFHAGWGVPGGYLGVDVFFVISGYLITRLLLRDHRAGTLSLRTFYERRARRVIPPLYVVMAACVPFAWLWMLPEDLENFGESLVASALFVNNVLLYLTSGYWAQANEFKPLLHTWSLGIEEQIYLAFPLLLLWGLRGRWWLQFACAAVVGGIAWAQWQQVDADPLAAYMLPPARAAEFLAGALLATMRQATAVVSSKIDEVLAWGGLGVLAACVVALHKRSAHPGLLTLLPVGATLAVLHAAPGTSAGRVLASRVPVAIGLASYSLYLWHQPILAFLRIRSLEPPGVVEVSCALLLSAVVSALSWRFVERAARERMPARWVWGLTAAGILALGGIGALFYLQSGFVHGHRAVDMTTSAAGRRLNAAYNERVLRLRHVPFADSARIRVLVVGDSQARDFVNAALESGHFRDGSLSYSDALPDCMHGGALDPVLIDLMSKADAVVFGHPHPACWPGTVDALSRIGVRKLVGLGPKYFGWNMNAVVQLDEAARSSYRPQVPASIRAVNEELAQAIGPARYVDQLRLLGGDAMRITPFAPDRLLMSQDGTHLTAAGARHMGRLLFDHPLLRDLRE